METTLEYPETNIGKFTMHVQESSEPSPDCQQRVDAIAAWLLSEWNKRQAERN
jgi:hypothetical protein